LERYPTISPFSRLFYRLILDLLEEAASSRLTQAFLLFIRCESRRHDAVSRVVRRGKIDLMEVITVGRKSYAVLDILRRRIEAMEVTSPTELIARELILAECNYHLGRTVEVVERLRKAVRMGTAHPLVHFALGYNLYVSAMQNHTRTGRKKGEVIAKDPVAFVDACQDAIAAFRAGLGDQSFDAQIYWWIGLIHEMLGERGDARTAYRSAMETDPEHFTDQTMAKLDNLRGGRPQRSSREAKRLDKLGPIGDDDVAAARAFLDACDGFPFP
jgi:hypothetical protein